MSRTSCDRLTRQRHMKWPAGRRIAELRGCGCGFAETKMPDMSFLDLLPAEAEPALDKSPNLSRSRSMQKGCRSF